MCVDDTITSLETKDEALDQLRELLGKARLQNTALTLKVYMGKEHTISKWSKLDVDEFKLKQEFLQGCQDLNPSLVIKHTKQTPGYKRRVANKHKEHEHHKLVVY